MDKSDFDLEVLYITTWLVLDYFSYRDRVIMNDFIDIGDYITRSDVYDCYWSIWFIDDLEDGYIDDFEDMSWLYTLLGLLVITHPKYLDLLEKLDRLYLVSTW